MELARGANALVAASAVSLVLEWDGDREVDPHALLLAPTGKIRSDADFVFFNAPRHPSGTVVLEQITARRAGLAVRLSDIEPAVDRVVIAGSVAAGTFLDVPALTVSVQDAGRRLVDYRVSSPEAVQAMVFGEFYRRDGGWKFRAVGQGWSSGLRGLAEEFGVAVDDDQPPASLPATPTPAPVMAPGWYVASQHTGQLQWWNGTAWTADRRPQHPQDDPATCGRCGRPRAVRRMGGTPPCQWCLREVHQFMETWRGHAWRVLTADGPRGPRWDDLWVMLRFHLVSEDTGREALRPLAVAHLERMVAFAFADNQIDQEELDDFDRTVAELRAVVDLSAADALVHGLRQRMLRGRSLTQVRAGDLPRVSRPDLHLEMDELLHVDVDAEQIRYLASGPKQSSGRLIGSSRKLRFIGAGAGSELAWAKIVSVRHEYDTVVIDATTARGGGSYRVRDAEYVAAVLEGALRIAKRLVLAPGQRDSRAIPQDVKAQVWQRDAGKCAQCGAQEYLEFDHVIPWSRGGATSVDNLQILCRGCNLAKGARM
ncbi:TerD family protein [Nocardia niigatensis]|uniref:TerD family protein n=1 Tax=Nocardia niigatensis TaxID=209249 RepID=UPI000593D183|nr:TerD family protein [Nocardia niigatensis]